MADWLSVSYCESLGHVTSIFAGGRLDILTAEWGYIGVGHRQDARVTVDPAITLRSGGVRR